MNTREISENRELTAEEIDLVAGSAATGKRMHKPIQYVGDTTATSSWGTDEAAGQRG
jgi:hypothetical protein